ncbi:MAG: alkaline phosphatase family protein [Acidithiobacillales bacterium]
MVRSPRGIRLFASLFVLAGTAGLLALEPSAPAPKLAVIVSVDGLSESRLLSYRPWYTAGLKRLLDEGRIETNAFYRHLNTETGPGHASLGTGAPPRVHGIVLNSWYAEKPGRGQIPVYCTDQPDPSAPPGSSRTIPGPANLLIPTLGDRLAIARPGARVVSLSGKDRAAIFLAGKNPAHAVYWYVRATGRFATSAAYDVRSAGGAAAASLVERFNRESGGEALRARLGTLWKKLPPPPVAAARLLPTPVPPAVIRRFQVPSLGLGWDKDLSKFVPWSQSEPSGYFAGLYRSPFIDEATADLVQAFLSDPSLALGRRGAPDLLAVGFSGHDPVSHDYGNESEEELDALRRLDVQIGRLLDALTRQFPKGSILVALSADHGFNPIPEVARALGRSAPGGRVVDSRTYTDNIVDRLNRMLAGELCFDRSVRPVLGMEGWSLFYRKKVFPIRSVGGPCGEAGREITAADVDRVLPKLVKLGYDEEIEGVLPVSQMSSWPQDSPAAEFVRNDFDPARSGDAFLIPRPGVLAFPDPGRGSMHGTHHENDTHVPLVFWGGPAVAGTSNEPVTPYDLAPTVGAWLGVTLPDATGRALTLGR